VHLLCDSGGYGGVAWGAITGTLSDQTDLQTALAGKQPLNDNLTVISSMSTTGYALIVATVSGMSVMTTSDAVLQLLNDTSTSAMRTTLGLGIGTNVQAYSATLATIASIGPQPNQSFYFTDMFGGMSPYNLSLSGRGLIGLQYIADMQLYLDLQPGYDIQAWNAELQALATLTSAADRLPYFTGSETAALATFTAAGRALVDDADAAAQRVTLEVPEPHPGFRPNYYYSSFNGYTAGARALVANRMFLSPFFVPRLTTFTRIGCNVAVLAASSLIRLGIYANANGVPTGTPILDAGGVFGATTGEKEIIISKSLAPGWYWLAVVSDGVPQLTADTNATLAFRPNMGFATGAGTGYAIMQQDITFGALPSIGSPIDGPLSAHPYRIWLRIVPAVATPGAPTNLRLTACSNGASIIAWNATAGATSYILEVSGTIGGTYTQTYLGAESEILRDIGSGGVTGYWFRVSASNGSGQSAPSASVQLACNYW
jgi:hypothetical protein